MPYYNSKGCGNSDPGGTADVGPGHETHKLQGVNHIEEPHALSTPLLDT